MTFQLKEQYQHATKMVKAINQFFSISELEKKGEINDNPNLQTWREGVDAFRTSFMHGGIKVV